MGIKLATAFIAGALFTFFLDFFLFLGLFLNYIEAQNIDVYYNVLFADHQSFILFFIGTVIFGYFFIFLKNMKIATGFFFICFGLVNLSLIPSVGFALGEMMFQVDNKILQENRHSYIGHIVYEGRDTIWFFDDELNEIVEINSKRK